MKSILYLSLLLLSLSSFSCQTYCGDIQKEESYYECQKYQLREGDKYCCYQDISYEMNDRTYKQYGCFPATEELYNNLDSRIEEVKNQIKKNGGTVYRFDVDCGKPSPSDKSDDSESDSSSEQSDSPTPIPTPEPSSTGGCSGALSKSYGECKDLEISSGYEQCCYFHSEYETDYKKVQDNFCNQVTKSQYYDLQSTSDSLKKSLESQGYKVNKFTIDCGDVVYHCGDKPGKSYSDCKNLKVSDSTSQCCHIHEKYDYLYHDIEIDRCAELTNIDYADKNGYLNAYKSQLEEKGYNFKSLYVSCSDSDDSLNQKINDNKKENGSYNLRNALLGLILLLF